MVGKHGVRDLLENLAIIQPITDKYIGNILHDYKQHIKRTKLIEQTSIRNHNILNFKSICNCQYILHCSEGIVGISGLKF